MNALSQIKAITGITDQDDTLSAIISLIESRLMALTGQKTVPPELAYITVEASIARFNRIGDEGKASGTENEVSATWQVDDLAAFRQDIDDWVAKNKALTGGVVRFL